MKMKIVTIVFLMLMVSGVVILSPGAVQAGQVTAADVADHMDKSKYSSADIKKYLKALKGEQVSADGKVHEVLTGRSGVKVVVSVNIPGRSKEFIVDVHSKDAASVHVQKGDRVSCKGEYVRYNMFTLNGVGIDGSCTKK
jgi:hypothetical protein